MNLLATLLISTIPMDLHIVRDGVDCVEVNHVYDGDGNQTFVQAIGWEWERDRHCVAGWRTMADKHWRPPAVTWMEGSRLYVLRGKYWRETFSQYDPELAEREVVAQRRGIMGEKR